MSFTQIINDIKNKNYSPVYFLHGEEPYYIDKISDSILTSVLSETEKSFNQFVIYGKDTNVVSIINHAKRYPMMSKYQVIVVKEAQHIKNIEEMLGYLMNPQKTTILTICYKFKKMDGRTKFTKMLAANAVLFESKKLYDNQIPAWVKEYVLINGYRISSNSTTILTEYLGNDLSKIANELNKLFINICKGAEINEDMVYQYIGVSRDYNVFELNTAIGSKNSLKAYSIIKYFASNPKDNPVIVTINSLYSYFSKIYVYHFLKDKSKQNIAEALKVNPYFVNEYVVAAKNYNYSQTIKILYSLREYDAKSKGIDNSSTEDGELLKELVFKILN